MKKRINTGLLFSIVLLTGCAGKHVSSQPFRMVLTHPSVSERQMFSTDQIELLTENETNAAAMLRSGDADCGYGMIQSENAIHYGILKSTVVERKEVLLVSSKHILSSEELNGLVIGYPDDLEETFTRYFQSIPDAELHAYSSAEELKKGLTSGLLDLVAAEPDQAFQILELKPDQWKISQPSDLPILEYRFFACTQEALDQAAEFRKSS